MGTVSDILRSARQRERRIGKVRDAAATLTFDEKGSFVAELLRELKAGPPKPERRRKTKSARGAAKTPKKMVRDYVLEALSEHSPLNAAGIHAVIERTSPGVVDKGTLIAAVSRMFAAGQIVKAGMAGRGTSFALPNGGAS